MESEYTTDLKSVARTGLRVQVPPVAPSNMIPKIAHISWDDKDVLNNPAPLITHGLKNFHTLNPDWAIRIHTAQEVNEYLQAALGAKDWQLFNNTHIVERLDFWRLLKIYNEGGVYMDIDRFCNRSFDSILKPNTEWVLPTQNEFDFSQDFMMSSPHNPAFDLALNIVLGRRRDGQRNTYYLGPQTYMHAVTKALCGREINTNPGLEVFEEIRAAIAQHPFIVTYRENGPYDTVIYQRDSDIDFVTAKREFYQSYGVGHWAGEW